MVSLSFMAREKPRKIRDKITPEFPRAPRSMAEAHRAVACPTAHVGARVPVGHREDVELVNLLLFRVQRGGGVNQHRRKGLAVNCLYHDSSSLPSSQSICMEST